MDNILTKDRDDADIALAAKDIGGVLTPRNILQTPSGVDISPATETTASALLAAAQAIQAAAEALNGKATTINTGAVAGTVALDSTTLAALETINANTGGLTNTELRSSAVPVSGTFWQDTQPVSFTWSGLTDTQLRASAVPVSGPLTDTQLRATAVPVSGTFWQATQPVSFSWAGLTDTQLRASAVPVSLASLPSVAVSSSALPTGAATETTLSTGLAKIPAQGPAAKAASTPVTIATDQPAIPVQPVAALLTSYSLAGVIAINTVLATLDCSQYRGISVQCVSMGTTGVVTPEWSNDGTTWVAATILTQAGVTALSISAAGLWTVPALARYLRLRLSKATTAGTTTFSVHQFDDRPATWLASQPVSLATNTPTLAAGTNLAGDVGVQYRASATGAASVASVMSPATPAATAAKASAGRLLGWRLVNTSAAIRSVKFWNTAVAGVTLGTTAALWEIDIPAGGSSEIVIEGGLSFSTVITYAITGAKGLTDNTGSLAANDVTGILIYA